LSDLLAPRESARRQLFLVFTIATGINGHGAKKELKSGRLAPLTIERYLNFYELSLVILNISYCYRMRAPVLGSRSKPTSVRPASVSAASSMPWDSTPMSFVGLRLTIQTMLLPTISSGL